MSKDEQPHKPIPFEDVVKKLVNTPPQLKFSRKEANMTKEITCKDCGHKFKLHPDQIMADGRFQCNCPQCGVALFGIADPEIESQ